MKITLEGGAALLTPTSEEELRVLDSWRGMASGTRLKYEGRGPDSAPGFWTVKLLGGQVSLTLCGDTKDDQLEVNGLRNACFFGKVGGLLYLGHCDDSVRVTGGHCDRCQAPIVDAASCEWAVCRACAEKCPHPNTEDGFTHSETIELGYKKFCTDCGREVGPAQAKPPQNVSMIAKGGE